MMSPAEVCTIMGALLILVAYTLHMAWVEAQFYEEQENDVIAESARDRIMRFFKYQHVG